MNTTTIFDEKFLNSKEHYKNLIRNADLISFRFHRFKKRYFPLKLILV